MYSNNDFPEYQTREEIEARYKATMEAYKELNEAWAKFTSSKRFKIVASAATILIESVVSILFIFYIMGIYGVILSLKKKASNDVNFYTIITLFNMLIWCLTIYLIVR